MISGADALYGALLSAFLAAVLVFLLGGERQTGTIAAVAIGAFTGPMAWNSILITTHGRQFFVDAPVPLFPVSWQDTGSAVFTLAALLVVLGFGPLRSTPGRRVALLSVLAAFAALLTDVYLY